MTIGIIENYLPKKIDKFPDHIKGQGFGYHELIDECIGGLLGGK